MKSGVSASSLLTSSAPFGQPQEIAARIAEESHPFLAALLAEGAGFVAVNKDWRLLEADPAGLESGDGCREIGDGEIERPLRRTRRQHEARAVEVEERQARRIEAGDECEAEEVAVGDDRGFQILCLQRDLMQVAQSVRWLDHL